VNPSEPEPEPERAPTAHDEAYYAEQPVWAVVGASNARHKYGNRIYRTLREAGYRVYAVNRHQAIIEGDTAYARVTDLPEAPDVVNLVVPPDRALAVVQDAHAAGAKAVWFQPGAEDAAAAAWAAAHGMDVIHACILVAHNRRGPGAIPPAVPPPAAP